MYMKLMIFPELEKPLKYQHIQLAVTIMCLPEAIELLDTENNYLREKTFMDYRHLQMFSCDFSSLIKY